MHFGIFLIFAALSGEARAQNCQVECSADGWQILEKAYNIAGDQYEDFKASCESIQGRTVSGMNGWCDTLDVLCVGSKQPNAKATGAGEGASLFEARQAARSDCYKKIWDQFGCSVGSYTKPWGHGRPSVAYGEFSCR